MTKCEACGRDIEEQRLILLNWSSHANGKTVGRTYNVCVNCNNDFMVSVSDKWAKEIASRIEMRDPKGFCFPPLICDGSYYNGYKNKKFSQVIKEDIDVMLNNLVQRIIFEERIEEKYR